MVNRELRGGATQSPGTLESRPGAERWIARGTPPTEVPVTGPFGECSRYYCCESPGRRAGRS